MRACIIGFMFQTELVVYKYVKLDASWCKQLRQINLNVMMDGAHGNPIFFDTNCLT